MTAAAAIQVASKGITSGVGAGGGGTNVSRAREGGKGGPLGGGDGLDLLFAAAGPPDAATPACIRRQPPREEPAMREPEDRIEWLRIAPFVALHLACFAALWTGVSATALAVCAGLYLIRMFAITAGYHRYFSHRSYRLTRPAQFVLAVLGASAAQRGPLWWAAHHRHHHEYSDAPADAHSPRHLGFLHSHVGWFTTRRHHPTQLARVPDLARFPELRFLDRRDTLVPLALAGALWALGALLEARAPQLGTSGAQLFVWGFCISTVLLFHATGTINSLAHRWGSRRYATADDSRNNALLALLTLGEGWHNNHHRYPHAARQGFRWYEFDPTWLVLRALQAAGIVREPRPVPRAVLDEGRAGARVRGKVPGHV